jgi:hypothetical protein
MGRDLTRQRWRTVHASVAGTSHLGSGEPCADACAVRVLPKGRGHSLLVAVAADGAGRSEHAAEGARLAVEAVVAQAERWARGPRPRAPRALVDFARRDAQRWVEAARQRIARAAASRGCANGEFSCTLLVALVDEAAAIFFQVGDGAIVYRGTDGRYVPALWPQTGEYANCTWFLTADDAAERVKLAGARDVDEVALFTDGLQGLALRYVSREAHGPFFEPMFARLRQEADEQSEQLRAELRAFLESGPVNQRTDDDKTLVLATRLPAPRGAVRVEGPSRRAAGARA